jgi:hypothetical protein
MLVLFTPFAMAQGASAQPQTTAAKPAPPANPKLDAVLYKIQYATEATKSDLSALRIERWKADGDQKAELIKISDSLNRNLATAVPDLIKEVRSSQGSVSTAFKLYHNLNVVYEYLNYLSDSARVAGKESEYTQLSHEAQALDTAREDLSNFVEQAAGALEEKLRIATAPPPAPTPEPVAKKIVVDDAPTTAKKPATTRKKKTSPPAPQPVSTPN